MKKWYLSRSIWVGVISLVYGLLMFFGVVDRELSPELIASILGVIIVILRAITREPVEWQKK